MGHWKYKLSWCPRSFDKSGRAFLILRQIKRLAMTALMVLRLFDGAALGRIEDKLDTVIEEFKARDGRTADLELRTRKLENRVDRLTRRG